MARAYEGVPILGRTGSIDQLWSDAYTGTTRKRQHAQSPGRSFARSVFFLSRDNIYRSHSFRLIHVTLPKVLLPTLYDGDLLSEPARTRRVLRLGELTIGILSLGVLPLHAIKITRPVADDKTTVIRPQGLRQNGAKPVWLTAKPQNPRGENIGVGGGVRTLGHWNHNPALYQLSYTHRREIFILAWGGGAGPTAPPVSTARPRGA
jgi:hypothetical protein